MDTVPELGKVLNEAKGKAEETKKEIENMTNEVVEKAKTLND